jgi:hypothetical protein
MIKIAIHGKMETGKTTLAKKLQDEYGLVRVSFADAVKDIAHKYFGASTDPKPRELYQSIGQGMRHIDEDVWVNHLLKNDIKHINSIVDRNYDMLRSYMMLSSRVCGTIKSMFENNHDINGVVIDDLRYRNEFNILKNAGFFLVRLNIQVDVANKYLYSLVNHVSEIDLDDHVGKFGLEFDKRETPKEMAAKVMSFIKE